MKYLALLLAIGTYGLTGSLIHAQTIVEFKTEMADGKLYFDEAPPSKGNRVESSSGYQEYSLDFSIGLSTPVYKNLYLNTAIGTNNFTADVQVSYPPSSELYGQFSVRQIFLEVLPELRFFDNHWLFINAGFGVHQITNAQFTNQIDGTYYRVYQSGPFDQGKYIYDVDQFPRFNGYMFNFAANVGCHFTYKNIGLVGSLGYRHSGVSRNSAYSNDFGGDPPGLGFKHLTYKLGISYSIDKSTDSKQ